MVRLVHISTFEFCPSSYLSCSESLGLLAELFPLHAVSSESHFLSCLTICLSVLFRWVSQQNELILSDPVLESISPQRFPNSSPIRTSWTVPAPRPKWILDEGNHTFCQGKIILDEVLKWNNWNSTFICMQYDYPSFLLCAWIDRDTAMFIFKKVAQWRIEHKTTFWCWNEWISHNFSSSAALKI